MSVALIQGDRAFTVFVGRSQHMPTVQACGICYSEVKEMPEGLFQPMHLIVILAIGLVVFGPGKLPRIGADLGKSIREFKKAISDKAEDLDPS